MLAESRERDEHTTRDNMNMIPLLLKWQCRYSMCPNFPGRGHCYVKNRQHYRIQHWMFSEWQQRINDGNIDMDHMPPEICLRCVPAAKPRPTRSPASTPASTSAPTAQSPQPWGSFSYMMTPAPSYMPFGYFPPQQAAPQQANSPLHLQPAPQQPILPQPVLIPLTSSPPNQPDNNPDVLIKGYFNYLIEKYPLQSSALSDAHKLLLESAFNVEDLWNWLRRPAEYPVLASIVEGLRKRIKTHLKSFLQSPVFSQVQHQPPVARRAPVISALTPIINLSQGEEVRTDEAEESEDQEEKDAIWHRLSSDSEF